MSLSVVSRTLASAVLALPLASGCAQKSVPETDSAISPASDAQPLDPANQRQSVRAYIDPVTGQLRDPTPAELASEAAEQAANKQATSARPQTTEQRPREVVLPDGTVEITLDNSAQRPLRACIQKSGELKMDHECESTAAGAGTGAKP